MPLGIVLVAATHGVVVFLDEGALTPGAEKVTNPDSDD